MKVSESSSKIRLALEKAIQSHQITRGEYDLIIHWATEDGMIDPQERALLAQLNDMLEDRSIKIVP